MDDTAIEISGSYEYRDVLRYCYFQTLRRVWIPAGVFAGFTLLFGLAYGGSGNASWNLAWDLVPLVAILALVPLAMSQLLWKRLSRATGVILFRFDAVGMYSRTSLTQGQVSWKYFHSVRETRTLFLLYQSSAVAHMLPKRFFQHGDQITASRAMVAVGIAPKVMKAPGLFASWF